MIMLSFNGIIQKIKALFRIQKSVHTSHLNLWRKNGLQEIMPKTMNQMTIVNVKKILGDMTAANEQE